MVSLTLQTTHKLACFNCCILPSRHIILDRLVQLMMATVPWMHFNWIIGLDNGLSHVQFWAIGIKQNFIEQISWGRDVFMH